MFWKEMDIMLIVNKGKLLSKQNALFYLEKSNPFALKMHNKLLTNMGTVAMTLCGRLHRSLCPNGWQQRVSPFPLSWHTHLHESCAAILDLQDLLTARCHQIFHHCEVSLPASLCGRMEDGGWGGEGDKWQLPPLTSRPALFAQEGASSCAPSRDPSD